MGQKTEENGKPKNSGIGCVPTLKNWKMKSTNGVLKEAKLWCAHAEESKLIGRVIAKGCFGDKVPWTKDTDLKGLKPRLNTKALIVDGEQGPKSLWQASYGKSGTFKWPNTPNIASPAGREFRLVEDEPFGQFDYEDIVSVQISLVCKGKCLSRKTGMVGKRLVSQGECRCNDGEYVNSLYDRKIRVTMLKTLYALTTALLQVEAFGCNWVRPLSASLKEVIPRSEFL